jgi:hypothetical protein
MRPGKVVFSQELHAPVSRLAGYSGDVSSLSLLGLRINGAFSYRDLATAEELIQPDI